MGTPVAAKGTPCPAPQIQELEEKLAARDGEKEQLGKEVEALRSRLSSLEVGGVAAGSAAGWGVWG